MTHAEDGRAVPARPLGRRLALVCLPALALAMTWVVYRNVTHTYFFADDFVCMVDIENAGFVRFVLRLFGGHILIVRNAVFWAVYQLFGFDPRPYYWMAVLTHLLNVWLVYRVVRGLTNGDAVLGCLGAAVWGTSPIGLGTIGWYSVYGQELVATFLLLVLDQSMHTPAGAAPSGARVAAWCALLLAGSTCFGTGIGVAMAFPLAAFLLLPATFARPGLRAGLLAFPFVVAGFYFGFRRLYPLIATMPMSEAILGNVAFSHFLPILAMLWHLIGFGIASLILGFTLAPNDYPDQTTNVVVGLYLGALVLALLTGDAAARRRLLALALLCIGAYAMVAIGRSNLYLNFKVEPEVASRQTRYHYAGILSLAIALAVAVHELVRRLPAAALVVLLAWIGFTARAYSQSTWHIDARPNIRQWVTDGQRRINAAIDLQPAGSLVSIDNEDAPRTLLGPMLGATEFPGLAGLFVLTYPTNEVRQRRVRFIERRPGVFFASRDVRSNRRLADLLVNPNAVAQAPAPQ